MLEKLTSVLIALLLTICACESDDSVISQRDIQQRLFNDTVNSIKVFIQAYEIEKNGSFCRELLYEFFNPLNDKYDCMNIGPRLITQMGVLNEEHRVDTNFFMQVRAFVLNSIRKARLKLRDVFFKRDLIPVLTDMKRFINFIGLKYKIL